MKRIGIVGLGLMGGSLAKRIRDVLPESDLFGLTASEETVKQAKNLQIFNSVSSSLSDFPTQLDIILVCTPMSILLETLQKLDTHIEGPCIFVDIGSVKQLICEGFQAQHPEHIFVGGHPMAGNEKSGIAHSDPNLLDGRTFFLMESAQFFMDKLIPFFEALGFRVIITTAKNHDQLVALSSHLPYLMATMTVQTAKELVSSADDFRTALGPGFRDSTRVAASDPAWGVDVCTLNQNALLNALEQLQEHLDSLRLQIQHNDVSSLKNRFIDAKAFLNKLTKG